MNYRSLPILFLFFPFCLSAQLNGGIKGRLVDSASKKELSDATITVIRLKDSSLVSYALTDNNGFFEIKSLLEGDYILAASYTGYELFKKEITISPRNLVINFNNIFLRPDYKTLNDVVISDVSPVRIHGDTISFKSSAFNSRPDATVEEVLKKLPGIQVQKDGTITAIGERVQKVYVDGKEFFGNDPKIATKNLTADMVDQIQVFDDMSEQARFTKIDDGSRSKSINIKLKKDKRRGDFGRVSAGAGTDSRYEGSFSLNHFAGDQRISLVGSGNNTNKSNYTFSDYSSTQGSFSQVSNSPGGGSGNAGIMNGGGTAIGIASPKSGGINFNDRFGPKIDFRASYFYSGNKYRQEISKFRRNTFPGDSVSETGTLSNSENKTNAHRLNGRWEYTIDSLNSVLYTFNLQFQDGSGISIDSGLTYSKAVYEYLAVSTNTFRNDNRSGVNYIGDLLYRRKFSKPGRTFTFGWRSGVNSFKYDNRFHSPVTTYNKDGFIQSFTDINQYGLQNSGAGNNTLSVSYTESIGNNKLLELNYALTGNKNTSDKKTYDYNSGSGKYDLVNHPLSNYFEYKNAASRIGFNFRQLMKKYNYQAGMAIHFSHLQNRSIVSGTAKDTTISQRFINFFPTANFNYVFSRSKSIRFFYRGRTSAPSIAQLQDVRDMTNPLQIKTGNSSLKQEFSHNFNVNYNSFQLSTERFLSGNLNLSFTQNKIVNSIDSTSTAVLVYKPENLNGNFNASGMISLSFPFKKFKGMNLNITHMSYLSRDPSLVYGEKYFTTLLQMNQSFGIGYRQDKYDLTVNGGLVFNSVHYDLQYGNNTNYFSQVYSADFNYRLKNNFYFLTDVDYYINSGRTPGYSQNVFLWNISAAKKFLPKNAAEIKLTVYDILKQNTGISRTIGENYFEDASGNVVPRFLLLTFQYNINKLGTRN